MTDLGMKGVHVFWLYQLYTSSQGMTSAEIAAANMVDRSLVCREIDFLKKGGYIDIEGAKEGKRRSYNSRITLTDSGKELARRITGELLRVQSCADEGISEQELQAFYTTLEKLHDNFVKMTTPTAKRII